MERTYWIIYVEVTAPDNLFIMEYVMPGETAEEAVDAYLAFGSDYGESSRINRIFAFPKDACRAFEVQPIRRPVHERTREIAR